MENDLTFEKALDFIAIVIVSGGILLTLYCLFTMVMVDNPLSWDSGLSPKEKLAILESVTPEEYRKLEETSKTFSLMGLIYSISVLLSSIITGVLLKVLSNMSKNLFEIRKDFKDFMDVYLEED